MLSYKTSVASLNYLMLQNPNIQFTLTPYIVGSNSYVPSAIFLEIIRDPASPKPNARRPPIFVNVCSRITVSSKTPLLLLGFSICPKFCSSEYANFSSSSSYAALSGS